MDARCLHTSAQAFLCRHDSHSQASFLTWHDTENKVAQYQRPARISLAAGHMQEDHDRRSFSAVWYALEEGHMVRDYSLLR
jgi:hypothetical protein